MRRRFIPWIARIESNANTIIREFLHSRKIRIHLYTDILIANTIASNANIIILEFLHLRVRIQLHTDILIMTKERNNNMIGLISYILHFLNEKTIHPLDSEESNPTQIRLFLNFFIFEFSNPVTNTGILIVNEGNADTRLERIVIGAIISGSRVSILSLRGG